MKLTISQKKLVKEYAKKLVGKRLNEASYVPEVYIEFSNIQNAKKFTPSFRRMEVTYQDLNY